MSKRITRRINYKELHSTGQIIHEEDNESLSDQLSNLSLQEDLAMAKMSSLVVDVRVLIEEIKDVIDENPIQGSLIDDVDASIIKLEELRITIRQKNLQFSKEENNDKELGISINDAITSVKQYIKTAKEYKTKSNLAQLKISTDVAKRNERSITFALEDLHQNIIELEEELCCNISDTSDMQLLRLKSDSHIISNRIFKLSQKYEQLLQSPIHNAEMLISIQEIGNKYVKLKSRKQFYLKAVDDEIQHRELDKEKHSNNTHLNIKLEKFHGYESSTDYYTFRSNFEKIYAKSTPTRLLPDLLKNNFLEDPALTLVRSIDNIDDIWFRLKKAYGDTKIMLTRKLQTLSKSDLAKTKDPEKLFYTISKFTNILREVMLLAKQHNIEANLYYGDALSKIYQQLGDNRLTRFLSNTADEELDEKQTWERLLSFLEKEEQIQQQKSIINNHKNDVKDPPSNSTKYGTARFSNKKVQDSFNSHITSEPHCFFCGNSAGLDEHVPTFGPGGKKIIQYFTCKRFVEKSPASRLSTLREKGFCFQCLLPGANAAQGKHQEGMCQRDFVCPHPSHQRYSVKKHVLVCDEHKDLAENKDILEKYKARCIKYSNLPDFSKEIKLSFHADCFHTRESSLEDSVCNRGIYLLQNITVNNNNLTIFFDNGCSDFILSKQAVTLLGSMATRQTTESIHLGGVGNTSIKSSGNYNVKLPLYNGKTVTLSGFCLDQITSTFPTYPLKDVEDEIRCHYKSTGGKLQLPKLPSSVGGEIHLMIGIKYLRYHPKLIYQLQSGLSIFESSFLSSNGGRGVVGGPHQAFTKVHKQFFNSSDKSIFLINPSRQITEVSLLDGEEVPLLGYQDEISSIEHPSTISPDIHLSTRQRLFEEVESTGCEISYRCPTCRSCRICKHHDDYEAISIREEVEQTIINSSVSINMDNSSTIASLPFIADPLQRLANNKDRATKVYYQQLRKLNQPSSIEDKQDIILS